VSAGEFEPCGLDCSRICDKPGCVSPIVRRHDGSRRCAAGHESRWVDRAELERVRSLLQNALISMDEDADYGSSGDDERPASYFEDRDAAREAIEAYADECPFLADEESGPDPVLEEVARDLPAAIDAVEKLGRVLTDGPACGSYRHDARFPADLDMCVCTWRFADHAEAKP
jgi:hypothetical protein